MKVPLTHDEQALITSANRNIARLMASTNVEPERIRAALRARSQITHALQHRAPVAAKIAAIEGRDGILIFHERIVEAERTAHIAAQLGLRSRTYHFAWRRQLDY